jgi:hypothetical protein
MQSFSRKTRRVQTHLGDLEVDGTVIRIQMDFKIIGCEDMDWI